MVHKFLTSNFFRVIYLCRKKITKGNVMKKSKKILLYVTDEQHKLIKLRAARMGISMSNYIVNAIYDKYDKDTKLGWPSDIGTIK